MTPAERSAIAESAFVAMRRLVPAAKRADLERHIDALLAICSEQATDFHRDGYAQGLAAGRAESYAQGKRDGIVSVECRVDARDLLELKDPSELTGVQ